MLFPKHHTLNQDTGIQNPFLTKNAENMFIIRLPTNKTIRDTDERENMASSRSFLKTAWMVKKLQNVQTGPKNSENPYRFIVHRQVIKDAKHQWLLKEKKNEQDGVQLQATFKLLSKTNDNSI